MCKSIQQGQQHLSKQKETYAYMIIYKIFAIFLKLAKLILQNQRPPSIGMYLCLGFLFFLQVSYSFIISFTRLQSTVMENICLDAVHNIKHSAGKLCKAQYQSAASLLVLLHDAHLSLFSSQDKEAPFRLTATLGPIEELQNTRILMLEWLVELECVLCVGQDGSIFTVNKEGEVDLKAQNEDGIGGASLSPTQDYLYIVTHNKTLIQLNMEFDLVSEIALDQAEEVLPSEPHFSWRADATHFIINYETVSGHKALTKDQMMNTFISPARSDPKQDGLVLSVSEKGKKNMAGLVSWQPSGSIIAGVDYQTKGQNKQYRIIFWEKNGLRHLQFNLQLNVGQVVELFWSLDSSVLFVKIKTKDSQEQLLMYYRANYHWFLKNTIQLNQGDICLSLPCEKHKKHKLLIIGQADFQIIEYSIRHSQKQWKNLEDELKCKHQFQYFIDGNTVHLTDLSKCLMPPPMSMLKRTFESNITAFSKSNNKLLLITEQRVHLLDLPSNSVEAELQKGELNQKRICGVRLQSTAPLLFQANNSIYEIVDSKIVRKADSKQVQLSYTLKTQEGGLKFAVSYESQQLKVNGNTMSQQCTSFVFYHEFLLFTVSTSNMYDKLFVINLLLDEWIQQENVRIKDKLSDFENKDLLNHRLVERGARILAISEGRVVFQLPRGNMEGIYPKVIMINQVQKKIAVKQYSAAFEIIRTHKLDFNLLFDLNPDQFFAQIELVLRDIKRTDYINLLVSQITDGLSSQLQYALSARQLEDISKDFELKMKGRKIKDICRAVSETLRKVGKEEYILSIFTSQIKEGRLNEVLFEIKELKQNDVEVVVAPHLTKEAKKGKKKLSSQEILEYVCWLVDANAIYEAALLTYDLQLAAMTARCTQKDPKEYIPYIQSLKEIQDQVQFRKKISLDLKRYDVAVKELSLGSPKQKEQSLELIKKHKLFKHGLMIYAGKEQLGKVKQLMIEELLATGETNEAYRICQSIGQHRRALQIAKGTMDTKKIKECLEIIYSTQEERIKEATQILNLIKEQTKSRIDLARLFAYIGQHEQAASIYLKHNEYRKAYKYLWKVSEHFREKEMKQGFALCFSIKRNDIIRDKKEFLQKYSRLLKVHKHKSEFGEVTSFRPRQNDDMYSEVSASSKSQSNYTISTTTGMRKKKDKKRSILTRNVKEGSLLEEEYLLAYIKGLEDKVEDNVKECKLLMQHLICMNLIEQAETLRNEVRDYISLFNTYTIKSFARTRFQESHPEAVELYFVQRKLAGLSIDSFNYLF